VDFSRKDDFCEEGRVHKPRRPRESPLYRLVKRHLQELLRVWPGRFTGRQGPLVEGVLREFLRCGHAPCGARVKNGYYRLEVGSSARPGAFAEG
jgi:hypothetical protein